jgi:RNA 3'-phosphate cyclase
MCRILIDGSHGEGGGQILRTALALSVITGKPFLIEKIRALRPSPGLMAQHLTGIRVVTSLTGSRAVGASKGSGTLEFSPAPLTSGSGMVDVGTAGSVTLILQSILLPLVLAKRESQLSLTGGTDVAWSPPVDYVTRVLLPHIAARAEIGLHLVRRGYYPKGGGRIDLRIRPIRSERPEEDIDLAGRGRLVEVKGVSHASGVLGEARVAERQARAAREALASLNTRAIIRTEYVDSPSIGSGITLWALFAPTEADPGGRAAILGGDALGARGKRAEKVGIEAARELLDEIRSGAAVDRHCADHLIPLLGLVGGRMKTSRITGHILSNIYVTERFLDAGFAVDEKRGLITASTAPASTTGRPAEPKTER